MRSLYGLKQAPRAWFHQFAGYATCIGFTPSHYLGELNYFLGIFARRDYYGRTPVDTKSKLRPEGVPISNPTLYRSLAGALKRIIRYVRDTLDFGLQLVAFITTTLTAYSDVDSVGCTATRRSTSDPRYPNYVYLLQRSLYGLKQAPRAWFHQFAVLLQRIISPLSGKIIEYNLISNTLRKIYDMGSNQVADDYLDGFISPFAMYDMGSKKVDHKIYEFIPSSASV
ncbi:ribonuclease H-like domain-containing protein [Tanacetum coccineum]